ncbi:MAG TPA: glycosyl hydrolase [Gammaproteobacteria bacterium]|nr:glycosyl hydrolase [Gammaproteobacteria bacterium]
MKIPLCLAALLAAIAFPLQAAPDPALQALNWRSVGPFSGGRVDAVAGIPGDKRTFYMGAADGGVWKTTDAGNHWANVSDCCLALGTVGALVVAPSDPKVIYAGTGEPFPRGDVLTGDGVWKSTDAGKTWANVGLKDTRIVSNILVDPKDPQHVYVGSLGHLFGPNPERGVYETRDGGGHWQRILFVDGETGVGDMAMDPNDPKTLYVAMWQASRRPWNFSSGGPGSGLWKSSDGGSHWTNLTNNPGLPAGILGRIGLALPAAARGRVYAVIEAKDGGLYRSDDGGGHWQRLYHKGDLTMRAWYFSRIAVDPKDADHLFVTEAPGFMISKDGGKTFKSQYMSGGDHHAMWIDPTDPEVIAIGNDGGAAVSLDGGTSWSSLENQPLGQIYRVSVDSRFPFHMYGSQQDCCSIEIPSATQDWGIDRHDWRIAAQWESGYVVPAPDRPWIVWSAGGPLGALERNDTRTGLKTFTSPWPEDFTGRGAGELKYRFQWTTPVLASVHASGTVYMGSQYVLKSQDDGHSWREISPDLTRHDPAKLTASGGPLHLDAISTEYYDTVFALAESPLKEGLLWAGTDDGKLWLTQDDGGHWQDVTPPMLPEWSTVSTVEASRFAPGTAYVAAHRYRLDDYTPYIFVTRDFGRHWQRIVDGLPADRSSFTVREDWKDKDLLFAGALDGAYFSDDGGNHWHSLQQNLPRVAVTDLAVVPQQDALAAATHGRSFWVLDQLQPLRELGEAPPQASLFLHTPGTAWLTPGGQDPSALDFFMGENPVNGASVFYRLAKKPPKGAKLVLSFEQPDGTPIASFTAVAKAAKDKDKDKDKDEASPAADADQGAGIAAPGLDAGMNLFVWDLRYASIGKGRDEMPGPQVVPGRYRVTLSLGSLHQSREFEVRADPRMTASASDWQARVDLERRIQLKGEALGQAALHIDALREALKKGDVPDAAARLARLEAIAATLVTPDYEGYLESLAHPSALQSRLGSLMYSIESSYARPSPADEQVFEALSAEADGELAKLRAFDDIKVKDVQAFRPGPPAARLGLQRREDKD